jgi:uncharacterized protein (TIGR02246 family)
MTLRLEDIELIKQLKYKYAYAIDTRDLETLRTLFAQDASIDYRGGTYRFQLTGRDAIVDAMAQAFHAHFVGSHTMHMPVIEVHDDDTAEGRWTLIDYALDLADNNKTTVGTAHYRDRYVREDGRWLIQHTEYDRVYERVFSDPAPGLTAHMLADVHAAR